MPPVRTNSRSPGDHTSTAAPTLGAVIRALRGRRAMSQKALAIEAGIDQSVLAAIEGGRRPPPRDAVLQRLMTALNVSEVELREVDAGRLASRLVRALEGQPAATRAVIVKVALLLVRLLDQETSGS